MKYGFKFYSRILLAVIIFAIIIYSAIFQLKPLVNNSNIAFNFHVDSSINRGMEFLSTDQLSSGEFKTSACVMANMTDCTYDSSNFITSLVVYSIKDIKNPKTKSITSKALDFLLNDQEFQGGFWNYWTNVNPHHLLVPPDSEDTSLASFVLRYYNISFGNNTWILEKNKDNESLYMTWLSNDSKKNILDCVINANVVMYTQNNKPQVCSYINENLLANKSCSSYYQNRDIFYYTVSKAFVNGVSCLNESRNQIISNILPTQKPNGSFGNPMQTALALNALMNYGYTGPEIKNAVASLISTQNKDGSWPEEAYFTGAYSINESYYYGSADLTTALSLEALNKYLNNKSKA